MDSANGVHKEKKSKDAQIFHKVIHKLPLSGALRRNPDGAQ